MTAYSGALDTEMKTDENRRNKETNTDRNGANCNELKQNNDVALTKTQQNRGNENKLTHEKPIEQSAEVKKDRRIQVLLY